MVSVGAPVGALASEARAHQQLTFIAARQFNNCVPQVPALQRFARHAKVRLAGLSPSQEILDAVMQTGAVPTNMNRELTSAESQQLFPRLLRLRQVHFRRQVQRQFCSLLFL